jgi:hypothetical protein
VLIPGDSDADYDLEAALDQYPDGVTGEIREVLASQGAAMYRGLPAAGRREY